MTANHRALEEADRKLVERVKLTPSLYDPRNPDFRLAYRKDQEWESVATLVGLTAADARRRWTCLRDRYSRELKKLRLHPDKSEFGKNEFFCLMDFLRKFVSQRRERRRNHKCKYESSWDCSMDTKLHTKDGKSEDEVEDFEEIEENNYEKLDVIETATYSEYVEVNGSDTYEEYVEHRPMEISDSTSTKNEISNTLIPTMLPQARTSSYGLATQQNIHTSSQQQHYSLHQKHPLTPLEITSETEDDFFCKSIAVNLKQLSRRHKIKAKVEMLQILEKYIELEENSQLLYRPGV